jgi:prophage regulatory protein
MEHRYMRKKEICFAFGISRSTLERQVAEGIFPKPVKLGKRIVAWPSDEVEKYRDTLPRMDDAYSCRADRKGGAK